MIYTLEVMDEGADATSLSVDTIPDLVRSDKFIITEVNIYLDEEWKMSIEFEGNEFIIIRESKTDDKGMEYIEERTIPEIEGWMSLVEGMTVQ